MATQHGYTTVISSCLSILGVLGLVKSSIKLALGLQQCISSGWDPAVLRGILGYTLDESDRATGDTIECLRVTIFADGENLIVDKERQRFDKDNAPILEGGWNHFTKHHEQLPPSTVVNLGNKLRESEFTQSPYLIGALLFSCSGITSWALLIASFSANGHWHWTVLYGIIALHVSLIVMITPTLVHAHRTCRPATYINGQIWNFLSGRQQDPNFVPKKFTFWRTCTKTVDGYHQVLHFTGDVSYIYTFSFKVMMTAASAVCTAAYVCEDALDFMARTDFPQICQYAVLKGTTSTAAAVWIGVQAAFALIRVLIWILDPPFDDPRSKDAEYMTFLNSHFPPLCLMNLLTDFMGDGKGDFEHNPTFNQLKRRLVIPLWAWTYTQNLGLYQILQMARPESFEDLPVVDTSSGNPAITSKEGSSSDSSFKDQEATVPDSGQYRAMYRNDEIKDFYCWETSLAAAIAAKDDRSSTDEEAGARRRSSSGSMPNEALSNTSMRTSSSTRSQPSEDQVKMDFLLLLCRVQAGNAYTKPFLLINPQQLSKIRENNQPLDAEIGDEDTEKQTINVNTLTVPGSWRFGGRTAVDLNWVPIPPMNELYLHASQRPSRPPQNNCMFKFHEDIDELSPFVSRVQTDYLPGSDGLEQVLDNRDTMELLRHNFDFDFGKWRPAQDLEEFAVLLDPKFIPLPRTWRVWARYHETKSMEPATPSLWLDKAADFFNQPAVAKNRGFVYMLTFANVTFYKDFVAHYIDYDNELPNIKLLKRARKLSRYTSALENRIGLRRESGSHNLAHYVYALIDEIFKIPKDIAIKIEEAAARSLTKSGEAPDNVRFEHVKIVPEEELTFSD